MVALDDRAAVHRDDVALLQRVVAGDPVDDHRVGRRADHRGEPVVVEEVGARPATVDDVGGDLVQLLRRHPRGDRGPRRLVHLGDDPAREAHLAQLVGVAAHQACTASTTSQSRWNTSSTVP